LSTLVFSVGSSFVNLSLQSVLDVHLSTLVFNQCWKFMWFLNELLVSLIMLLLSSKYVDEKGNPFIFTLAAFWR
jgi:hypothetical protein